MSGFTALWRRSVALSVVFGVVLTVAALLTGSVALWGLVAGVVPGTVDLAGLGMRLPLWARLRPAAAMVGINLRFFSRLAVLGLLFFLLARYTSVDLHWTAGGIFVPYGLYLLLLAFQTRGKGVNG
ncbi:MAG: hypothetical protein M0031_11875 [Thermaerobacter sp.]|jgi:hypothetical protein|nr:hypothetical protein [Thermaerobacter sp.]